MRVSYEFADQSCVPILSYVNFTPRGFTSIPEFLTFNLLFRSFYFKKFLEFKLSLLIIIVLTEGALTFTEEPKSPIFFKEGDNAFFKWRYSVANKTTELDSIVWRARNKTDGKSYALIVETANGEVTVNPNIPSAYRGRVDKIGQATLVIKRITLDDSTSFTCTLISKTGPGNDKGSDPVELIVTGTILFYSNLLS